MVQMSVNTVIINNHQHHQWCMSLSSPSNLMLKRQIIKLTISLFWFIQYVT